jgi:hypothetical protein
MEVNWLAAKHGILSRCEIVFLRDVIRAALVAYEASSDRRPVDKVARDVLNAYQCGIRDRTLLIEIARSGWVRQPSSDWTKVHAL